MLAALAHRHVVVTLGIVEQRGATALALEYLPGGDLVPLARRASAPLDRAACARPRRARAPARARVRSRRREGAQRAVRRGRPRAARRLRVRAAARRRARRRRHDGRPPRTGPRAPRPRRSTTSSRSPCCSTSCSPAACRTARRAACTARPDPPPAWPLGRGADAAAAALRSACSRARHGAARDFRASPMS